MKANGLAAANGFNRLPLHHKKTVETVMGWRGPAATAMNRGVNEKGLRQRLIHYYFHTSATGNVATTDADCGKHARSFLGFTAADERCQQAEVADGRTRFAVDAVGAKLCEADGRRQTI